MSDVVKIEFTVESGIRKVGKLKQLASEIDNHYARLKSETGQTLNYECAKQPWSTSMRVSVEGYREAVRDFLKRIRTSVEKFGLKGILDHWYEMA